MDETHAKQLLAEMLLRFSAGSVLHLLSDVLRESAPAELAPDRVEPLRDAAGTLFVVGLGLDAVWPGRGGEARNRTRTEERGEQRKPG